jgi:hypothetical protein
VVLTNFVNNTGLVACLAGRGLEMQEFENFEEQSADLWAFTA